MSLSQLLVWTALPNGVNENGNLNLSVFLAPQLTATVPKGQSFAPLSLFPDFVNWPVAINESPDGPISFTVTVTDGSSSFTETSTIVTPAPPYGVSPGAAWTAIFDAETTQVEPFTFEDYSARNIHSFPNGAIESFVSAVYGNMGSLTPSNPMILTAAQGNDYNDLLAPDPNSQDVVNALLDLTDLGGASGLGPLRRLAHLSPISSPTEAFSELQAFHQPLIDPVFNTPTPPTLDFHQGLTGLNNYPVVLRMFNLVFDLEIAFPDRLSYGQIKVLVTPKWSSQLGNLSKNVTPWTVTNFGASTFQPWNQGPDYTNGMMNLADPDRFSVSNLDSDMAGDRLISLGNSVQNARNAQSANVKAAYGRRAPGQLALTVPALRSSGPQVIWTGYAAAPYTGFTGLLDGQATLQSQLQTWLADPIEANLPVIYAEQLMRGNRVDVYTYSEASPTWRSLCGRYGQYTFGPHSESPITFEYFDEGLVSPSASQKADSIEPVPLDLWVHESIFRWRGWGLCAQRPGTMIDRSSNTTIANGENQPIAPVNGEPSPPQMSAYFLPPSPAVLPANPDGGVGYLFPKLRFGNQYQFRARGVDLAGNSLPVSSSDNSTATPVFTHYRYEPVRPPILAGMAPFTPGESTYFLTLLNYQLPDSTPTTNGRWIFPPSVSELFAEQHGVLDGFSFGSPPNPNDGPASDAGTYNMLVNMDLSNLSTVSSVPFDYEATPIGTFDTNNNNVPYFTGSPTPWTPYAPDPLSYGPAFVGLPGTPGPEGAPWNGTWPQADPMWLTLEPGAAPNTAYVPPSVGSPGLIQTQLPPAGVAVVRVSSGLSDNALDLLGVWQWFGPAGGSSLQQAALEGQVWLLSPFVVLRMVHAVRLPLVAPSLQSPVATRTPGDLSVYLNDPEFLVDAPSTSHVDVVASWTDIYDNPNDTNSDPSAPPSSVTPQSRVSSGGPAFRLTIPDPNPTGPEATPLTIQLPPQTFVFNGYDDSDGHSESATHRIGDTKHHVVNYTATGTSRFADLFEETVTVTLATGTSTTLGTPELGINANSVEVSVGGGPLVNGVDFTVDEATRTLNLLATATNPLGTLLTIVVNFQPTVTVTGNPWPVEVLSSAPPKAPVINQIVPAWQLEGPAGSIKNGISLTRTGGYLRVYLDRPWYSSGDGELLGVVTTVTTEAEGYESTFPSTVQQAWVTMMGLDPINYVGASHTPWPVVPTQFGDLAVVPPVPYRPPYANPPQTYLQEDTSNLYQIWPYDVHYDANSQRWYADVAPRPGITQEGIYPPPPGYFIRLALVRFQPFSQYEESPENGVLEVSPVVLATFAQPVADRSVTVVANSADKTGKSVLVEVTGPGYQGWRPPAAYGGQDVTQYDAENPYAPSNPSIYGSDIVVTRGKQSTSTITVEVQVKNPVLAKAGLGNDFIWESVTAPVELKASFSGEVYVTWGSTKPSANGVGVVKLPDALSSATKMRLRINEIDYYADSTAPTSVNTQYRRPFVSHIPIN